MHKLGLHHDHAHEDEPEEEMAQPSTPPCIFDAHALDESVPAGFNAVKISLDGKIDADLNWERQRLAAEKFVEKGLRIFWEIDLGLFSQLRYPLDVQSQFLSLTLSLQHFRETLWQQFRSATVGLCLYRGQADFSQSMVWSEQLEHNLSEWLSTIGQPISKEQLFIMPEGRRWLALFCRDAAAEYLELLAKCLPDTLERYLLLDASTLTEPLTVAQLLTQERFPLFKLAVRGSRGLGGEVGWDDLPTHTGYIGRSLSAESPSPEIKTAVCLPLLSVYTPMPELNHHLELLLQKQIPFRIVPEAHLTAEWDGLDYLIVSPAQLSAQGHRKLHGFTAAGGTIISLDLWGVAP